MAHEKTDPEVPPALSGRIHPDGQAAVEWFVGCIRESFDSNLVAVAAYGPIATTIYDPRHHLIHHLIVTETRDVDKLLKLATHSTRATRRGIAPPLVITHAAMLRSLDVFPLEWLDNQQFHVSLFGPPVLTDMAFDSKLVRLQCERELRSLDIQIQRGILASGGKPRNVGRLEQQAADTLVRVLRGICWLDDDTDRYLPERLVSRCEQVTKLSLAGCLQSISPEGKHDIETARLLIDEVAQLSQWIDNFNPS